MSESTSIGIERRLLAFSCEGDQLMASLDMPCDSPPAGAMLIVSGGNEIRSGAFAGQAALAAQLAAMGHAVLRFDRRGVGDSEGENTGFEGAGEDIATAMAVLREIVGPDVRVVAMGNCDAASSLMLNAGAGADALLLTNPWTILPEASGAEAAMPAAALRAHYRARLLNWAAIKRLLTGKVQLGALLRSLRGAARPAPAAPNPLAEAMAQGLARFAGPVRIALAGRDRTAHAFLGAWNPQDPRIAHCPPASHAFAEAEAREWLLVQALEMLKS